VFVGAYAPAVLGDYVAGTNHVLPTGGTARFSSALRVANFQKHIHVVRASAAAVQRVGPAARVVAEAEGLHAHADALRMREESSSE
jgi:histidinol dehydrogenase